MAIDIKLEKVDINQCATDNSLFANTHRCRTPSTKVSYLNSFKARVFYLLDHISLTRISKCGDRKENKNKN